LNKGELPSKTNNIIINREKYREGKLKRTSKANRTGVK